MKTQPEYDSLKNKAVCYPSQAWTWFKKKKKDATLIGVMKQKADDPFNAVLKFKTFFTVAHDLNLFSVSLAVVVTGVVSESSIMGGDICRI